MFALEVSLLAACLLGARISTGQTYSDCPSDFEYIENVNVCLKPILKPLVWDDAVNECEAMVEGAHLAVVTSQIGNKAMASFLEEKIYEDESIVSKCKSSLDPSGGVSFWLGGQIDDYGACGGGYLWHLPMGILMPLIFTSWNERPDCRNGAEFCILTNSSVKFNWEDGDCFQSYCSLCEV